LAQNVYEGMYILNSNRYARDSEAVPGEIAANIEKAGGEVLVSRLWEERRLAYPIKGERKGTYWLTYFRLDSAKLADVRRQCQVSNHILRVLLLRVDPRIVDTLVAHAQAGRTAKSSSHDHEKATDKDADKAAVAVVDKDTDDSSSVDQEDKEE